MYENLSPLLWIFSFIFCIGCFVGPRNLSLNKKKGKQIVQLEDEDEVHEDEDEDEDEQIQDQEVEDDEGSEDLLASDHNDDDDDVDDDDAFSIEIEDWVQNGCYKFGLEVSLVFEVWISELWLWTLHYNSSELCWWLE